ncbi:hypothetical protein D3C85_1188540 [compost metagenome]
MSQPSARSPRNGICTIEAPAILSKNHQPSTAASTAIIVNFKLERRPATPVPVPRILIMSSSRPTAPPPSSAASGNHVSERSRLKSTVITVIARMPIMPAIVGILRLNLLACSFVNTSSFSPVVLVLRCFFQNL